uniref:Uncharacterized protein n=1 Tax=Mustela putorius furo TaxID=9669 RepID=M3YRW0_MUSPF
MTDVKRSSCFLPALASVPITIRVPTRRGRRSPAQRHSFSHRRSGTKLRPPGWAPPGPAPRDDWPAPRPRALRLVQGAATPLSDSPPPGATSRTRSAGRPAKPQPPLIGPGDCRVRGRGSPSAALSLERTTQKKGRRRGRETSAPKWVKQDYILSRTFNTQYIHQTHPGDTNGPTDRCSVNLAVSDGSCPLPMFHPSAEPCILKLLFSL